MRCRKTLCYLRKRLIEPLEERRRQEAEQRQREALERGLAEGRAETHAVWEAWNERRMEAKANGEPFNEPPPGTSSNGDEK